MTALRPQIFFYLKSNGPSSEESISHNITGFTNEQISQELGQLIEDGLLTKDEAGNFHIYLYLDAPRSEYRVDGLYNYQFIQEKVQQVPAQSRPSKWINENIYLIPRRDQGERGTCVGQSTAYAADLNAIKLTDWRPDLSQVKRNDIVDKGDVKFIKDTLPDGCASAECSYTLSREVGGIASYAYGSFTDYAIKAWQQLGICAESLWWTSKSATFDNAKSYPTNREKSSSQGALHTIEGYATIKDFDAIKDAIYSNGFVLMSINVYSNWLDNHCEGIFPEPKGDPIGSHALCWVGYDEDHLYCLHSWADWSLLGGISRNYWKIAHQAPYVPLDTHETMIAKDIYYKLTITTDVPCNITINNDTFRKTTRATGAFEQGTIVTVSASPVGSSEVKTSSFTMNSEQVGSFAFTAGVAQLSWIRLIWAKLISFLRH